MFLSWCFCFLQINILKWNCWIILWFFLLILTSLHTVFHRFVPVYIPTSSAQAPHFLTYVFLIKNWKIWDKLTYHSFVDTSGRHKALRLELEDRLLLSTMVCDQGMSIVVLVARISISQDEEGRITRAHTADYVTRK